MGPEHEVVGFEFSNIVIVGTYPGAPLRTGTPAAFARATTFLQTFSSCVSTHSHDKKSVPCTSHVGC